MSQNKIIPVIDLFAGPGGLGEGFSAFRDSNGERRFKINLSIEKDSAAYQTLLLRTFLREFQNGHFPDAYYGLLRNPEELRNGNFGNLFLKFSHEAGSAKRKALCAELGKISPGKIKEVINSALRNTDEFLLIGGPPCQAYSIAGRSRNKGKIGYIPEGDNRQYLYLEYLQVIADHAPALFVMENVKGLLSATLNDKLIFERILADLRDPVQALARERHMSPKRVPDRKVARYDIYSFVAPPPGKTDFPPDFVVRMEKYGIPQTRHRLIILGVRNDLGQVIPEILESVMPVPARRVLQGLPKLRSGLSEGRDSSSRWVHVLKSARERRWVKASKNRGGNKTHKKLLEVISNIHSLNAERGGEFIECMPKISYRPDWFLDQRLSGVCNHSSRSHMTSDLFRYLYASCFAESQGKSPMMRDLPRDLLPDHFSVDYALEGKGYFADRFRVQLGNIPATTITSHISKDGHYYIHPDPLQCRSLTVREAARIQTFPDNYFFCGGRTAQYIQVGNAVPPLLAVQLAEIVFNTLNKAGLG